MKARHAIITDHIFLVDYYAQRGGTLQSAIDRFAKYIKVPTWEVRQYANHRGHFAAHSSHRAGCLWLHEKAGTSIITHEISHATHHLFSGLGVTDFGQTDEIVAHYLGWLASEVVKKLW